MSNTGPINSLPLNQYQATGWHSLAAIGVSSGAPSVGAPSIGQVHGLDAVDASTGAPSVGTPVLEHIHVLVATGVSTGAPSVASPAIGQGHALGATGVSTGAPSVASPAIGQAHALTASSVSSGAPTTGAPSVAQVHVFAATALSSGTPTVGSPVISQTHVLTAVEVSTGPPHVGTPDFAEIHPYARPTQDITDGEWLPSVPAADLYSMIDEVTPDEGDYIYATSLSACRLKLSTTTLPIGGQRKVDCRSWSPNVSGDLTLRLYQGDTLVATRVFTLGATVQDFAMILTEEEATGVTDGSDLYVELESVSN